MLEKGKISVRQIGIIFIITAMALLVQLPRELAGNTGKASWLTPVAAAVLFLPIVYIVKILFASGRFESLASAYTGIFGRAGSASVSVVTLITSLLLMSHSLNAVVMRQVTSVTPSTPMILLAVILLAVVWFIARGGLTPIARMAEFIAPFLIVVIVGVLLLALSSVKLSNVYPVVPQDAPKVFSYSRVVFAALGLFVLSLTLSDQTLQPQRLYKMGLKCMAFLCAFAILTVFTTFGVLGENITEKASEPLFSVVKSISVFNTLERLDSLVLPIWMIADVISVVVYAYIAMHILKSLFRMKETRYLTIPVVAVCFLSTFAYQSQYMLSAVFGVIIVPALALVAFVFPLAALVVGKARKLV